MRRRPNPNEIIIPLKGAERVRKRPAVIFGSDGVEGCESAFYGLFENAVDEVRDGFADKITVSVSSDGVIEIEDNGSGVPMGWNEDEQDWNWRLIFSELYAGSKFGGDLLGGFDACAAQYASEFTEVYSYDGKNESYMHFTKGCSDTELRVTPLEAPRHGTLIRWRPDADVFTDINIPREYFTQTLRNAAMLHPKASVILNYCGGTEKFYYEDGILTRLYEIAGDSRMTEPYHWSFGGTGRDREGSSEYTYSCEIALCISDNGGHEEYHHNSRLLPLGGVTRDAIQSAVTEYAKKYLTACGKSADIDTCDIFKKIILICKTESEKTFYTSGARMAISNPFIGSHMSQEITKIIELEFDRGPDKAGTFFERLLQN